MTTRTQAPKRLVRRFGVSIIAADSLPGVANQSDRRSTKARVARRERAARRNEKPQPEGTGAKLAMQVPVGDTGIQAECPASVK
jgi:hypothetical protein